MQNYVIVGRPNVGKSSLFNFFLGHHEAFIKDEDGTTQDWRSKRVGDVVFWDTPGVYKFDTLPPVEIDKIFLVIENNILNDDKKLYIELKKRYENVVVIINKIDLAKKFDNEDYALFEQYVEISLKNRIGLSHLKQHIKSSKEASNPENGKKIWAIIGKPNVGKSNLINLLAKKDLHKVEDFEGTTKEFLPVEISEEILLDTPGQRKKPIFPQYTNVFGAIFMVDLKFERQDLKMIGLVHKRRKPIIVVINKIDKAKGNEVTEIENKIKKLWDIPIIKTSCLKKQNVEQVLKLIQRQEENYKKRIKTSELNSWLTNNISKIAPRIKFITQIESSPPKFFVDCKLEEHTQKMLKRKLMREFGFEGIPVTINLKK